MRFVREFPGQELQSVELQPHMIDNIVKAGKLPPFYEAWVSINEGLFRKCSDDDLMKWAKTVSLLGGTAKPE